MQSLGKQKRVLETVSLEFDIPQFNLLTQLSNNGLVVGRMILFYFKPFSYSAIAVSQIN